MKNQRGPKRTENEFLLNAKEAKKKQIQMNQERAEDESLFKAKEVDQNELMKSLHLKLKNLRI